MNRKTPDHAGSRKLLILILLSAVLVFFLFYTHPIIALLCTIIAILVALLVDWPALNIEIGRLFRHIFDD